MQMGFHVEVGVKFISVQKWLTIHVETDPFADRRWDAVVGEAEVDAGIEAADVAQLQIGTVMCFH